MFVLGGVLEDFTADVSFNNDKAIKVTSGARNVRVEGLSHSGDAALARANVEVDAGARNVSIAVAATDGSEVVNAVVSAGMDLLLDHP